MNANSAVNRILTDGKLNQLEETLHQVQRNGGLSSRVHDANTINCIYLRRQVADLRRLIETERRSRS